MSTPEEPSVLEEMTQITVGPGANGSQTGTNGSQTSGSTRDSLVGTVFAGRYEIERLLGKGGMSSVYAANDRLLKSRVAIKVMQSHLSENSNAVMRFKQEAIAVNQLKHNNIVGIQYFDITEDGSGTPYIVMDLLEGQSLSGEIAQIGALPVDRVLEIFEQACAALQHAHSRGIIHRDLKPSNLMLVKEAGQNDVVKIVDFGIAKMLPTEGEERLALTQTGEIFGSPLYMSPEQCTGQPLDPRSDIYSMGCILYEALSGEPPLKGGNVFETISKHCTELPAALAARFPRMPQVKALDSVILRAMAKEPAQRYSSMQSLLEDIQDLKRGRGKGPAAQLAQAWRSFLIKTHPGTKRLPLKAMLAACVAVATLAAATTYVAHLRSREPIMPQRTWGNFGAVIQDASPEQDRWTQIKVKRLLEVVRQNSSQGKLKPEKELRLRRNAAAWFVEKEFYNEALVEYGIIFKDLEKVVAHLPLPEQGDLAANVGDCFYGTHDYKSAVEWYEKATASWQLTTEFSGDDADYSLSAAKLADAYGHMSQPQKALDLLRKESTTRGWKKVGAVNNALFFSKKAEIETAMGKLTDADADYTSAVAHWKVTPQKENLAFAYYQQALVKEKLHQLSEAQSFFLKAAALYKELSKSKEYAATMMAVARVQYQQGNLPGGACSEMEGRSVWTSN
ncbi:MAG: serine/threonine-protein kinase [Candidatus Obscuribacterales bacterium]